MSLAPTRDDMLTVSEITRLIKASLEDQFTRVWVRGEISGLRRVSSGHLYFSVKDSGAVLPSVLWKTSAMRLGFEPHDGMITAFGFTAAPSWSAARRRRA